MRIDAIYESLISLCFFLTYELFLSSAGSNPIGGSVSFSAYSFLIMQIMKYNTCYYVLYFVLTVHNVEKDRKKGVKEKKSMPRPGFVLSNFRSASEDTTPTPRGGKEFGFEFNSADWAWKIKNILKLRSLPYTTLCIISIMAEGWEMGMRE